MNANNDNQIVYIAKSKLLEIYMIGKMNSNGLMKKRFLVKY